MNNPKVLSEERKALERLVARASITALVAVLAWLLLPVAWDKLSVFIVCVPFAAMLQPFIRFLENRCRFRRAPAVLIPVLLVVALVCAVVSWFASFGFSQLNNLLANAPVIIGEASVVIRAAFERLIAAMDGISPEFTQLLRNILNENLSALTVQSTALVGRIVSSVTGMAAGLPYAFVYLNFLIIALYFVTKDYAGLRARLPGGLAHDPSTNASRLTKAAVFGALGYLKVQTFYAIISLVVGTIYLQCFHFRYAWLIALCAAILEFLPLFGNGTLYIPWSIIAYVIGMNDIGTEIIILYLLLITFRRITEPKVMSANIGVSPLLSLVGMFVGMRMGGLLGLMGGPIVMTILGTVVKGHYLDGINRDIQTLLHFFRTRWGWHEPKPYTPPKNPPKPVKERKMIMRAKR